MSEEKGSQKTREGQMNVELSEEVAEGIYSNLAIINHSASEFVLDFIKIMPGVPKARVKSRIVLTPQHAKRFLRALQDNVARFENQYGEIQDTEQPQVPLNFGGPTGQA
ncbi:MAG TPA: DUF3467 domain-containing protein [Cryomorphaceae bacterium]|nr:hypothetical protein [Owenweeksia sp.]MBF97473.1 hypothetical protein [Owenweeksia sp.]HAD96456.1 DUF3467 domain-containing protein [Cryomorphaceae bacterium]HBF21784.1 DUF3467 domain-containing protein [Cryomorphaceae bacterium]HCQ15663.1 DUF3467 domain-containing protein [Cryomorphaceae bacterium]|tara:strand:+ start:127 stop:453 length:327 start_codon:yes stop_codon:yes gene_type:complete